MARSRGLTGWRGDADAPKKVMDAAVATYGHVDILIANHAESFFQTVTGQRYERFYAPVGQQAITVMDREGKHKQPADLSRGTREQLYLALRFGLIREFGDNAEHLPVIVDEVLVNFDPERAKQAVAGFVELANTNQVIVFTCHPITVDLFVDAAPNTEVIYI